MKREDSGLYSCSASNTVGEEKISIIFVVVIIIIIIKIIMAIIIVIIIGILIPQKYMKLFPWSAQYAVMFYVHCAAGLFEGQSHLNLLKVTLTVAPSCLKLNVSKKLMILAIRMMIMMMMMVMNC